MSHCTQWHSLRLLLDQSTFASGLGWIVTWIGPEGVPRGHSGSCNNLTQASPPAGLRLNLQLRLLASHKAVSPTAEGLEF